MPMTLEANMLEPIHSIFVFGIHIQVAFIYSCITNNEEDGLNATWM